MNGKQINASFEELSPSAEQTERMYRNILRMKHVSAGQRRRAPARAAIVAVMICLCTATAVFAIAYHLDSGFLRFLNPNPEQAEYLANGAYVVNRTVSNKNGTLEVKQVLGDEHLVYILMDFTAPKGTVLNAVRYRFEPVRTDFEIKDHNSAHGWGFELIDDGNPMDNKISLIMSINSEYSVQGKKLSLALENLEAAGPFPDVFETVVSGTWRLSFPLNFQNVSASYEINRPVNLYGGMLTLERVTISPVSVNLYITGEGIGRMVETSREQTELFDVIPVTLVFADGSTFTTTDENSDLFALAKERTRITSTKSFHQVMDSAQVKSVIIFDQEFALR